jgi:hypothetical protein
MKATGVEKSAKYSNCFGKGFSSVIVAAIASDKHQTLPQYYESRIARSG